MYKKEVTETETDASEQEKKGTIVLPARCESLQRLSVVISSAYGVLPRLDPTQSSLFNNNNLVICDLGLNVNP